MRVFFGKDQHLHAPVSEIYGGEMITPFETPGRVNQLLAHMGAVGPVSSPEEFGLEPLKRAHDPTYVDFLAGCWDEWRAAGFRGEAIATVMPSHRTGRRCPSHIEGKLGYFAFSGESAIMQDTFRAARASVNSALSAAASVMGGDRAAFALCRPPGHHCMTAQFGGYCYLNNAAIAAQFLRDGGADRVAILDIDFHHGNGTQDMFYARDDVLFCSLHGDPDQAYPFYLGYADETGTGGGVGCNRNYPLPPGTGFAQWGAAFHDAADRIVKFAPDFLVVSLGVDIYENDPQSFFSIASDDFTEIGRWIAQLNLPTVFIMEGGYAVADLGMNVAKVLTGFEKQTISGADTWTG